MGGRQPARYGQFYFLRLGRQRGGQRRASGQNNGQGFDHVVSSVWSRFYASGCGYCDFGVAWASKAERLPSWRQPAASAAGVCNGGCAPTRTEERRGGKGGDDTCCLRLGQ